MSAPITCSWFALCSNDAAGNVTHPVLGAVPTCSRCAAKHGLLLEDFPVTVVAVLTETDVTPCVARRVTLSNGESFYVSYSPLTFGEHGSTESFLIRGGINGEIDWSLSIHSAWQSGCQIDAAVDALCRNAPAGLPLLDAAGDHIEYA
jgi:hypothetical protein